MSSSECTSSSLDFFGEQLQQNEIVDGRFEKIQPTTGLGPNSDTIEFVVNTTKEIIDLQNCYLQTNIRIVNTDGTALNAGEEVSLINYPGATFYKQLELFLGNEHVATVSNYGYRSLVEALVNYTHAAKQSWMEGALWYGDTPGQHDTLGDANLGFKSRKSFAAESNPINLITKIHCDLFNQEKHLIFGVPLKLRLTRNTNQFCILAAADKNVKIEILGVDFFVRKLDLADYKFNEISSNLKNNDAKYYYPSVKIFSKTESPNKLSTNIQHPFGTSDVPNRILIAMVSNKAYNGEQTSNPFKFHHYNLIYANVTVSGKSIHASPLEFNIAKKESVDGYWNFNQAMGYTFKDDGCAVNRLDYQNGNFMLGFDLTASQCDGTYRDPVKSGELNIELRFGVALPETINVIVYAEFESMLTINNARRVVTKY